jgi:DUF1365 family protein
VNSAIYKGEVNHCRFVPKRHAFSYKMFLLWLDLDEVASLEKSVGWFSASRWAPVWLKRSDYLGNSETPLKQSVLDKICELSGKSLTGKVFLLSPLRTLGMYFSPVNFFYLQNDSGVFSHLLAEVSNTPWNERHCYLVDLEQQADCEKKFHVSPFNPMDMLYKWKIKQPGQQLRLSLSCYKEKIHFNASLNLIRHELNSSSLRNVVLGIPSMTIKTVVGIYWQALKLYVKGMPIYPHSAQGKH